MARVWVRYGLGGAALLLVAAAGPRALPGAMGGQWAVSRSADGHDPVSVCLADPTALAQWEQRQGRCTSVVISEVGNKAVIHYTCADGGFGRSQLTQITPRTLRIETQGISSSYPFRYTLHARRTGDCAAH